MQETIIVNILGGPGIGKSTCALQVVAEIKKQGYQAEYVQEVAKELVYAGDMEHLNGSLENQAYILSKQKERLDLLVGQVDFVITDSPLPLNLIYLKEHNEYYETEVLREFNTYKNINIVLGRNLAVEYQNEGRIHTLEESLVKDKEIVELLEKNSLPYRNFERYDISGIIEYITSEEQQRDNSSKLTLSSEEIEGIAKKIQQNANETNHFKEQLNYLERQIESNNVIALNNKKANDVLRSIGKSYPKENSLISFDNSIAYSLKNVKYPDNRLRSISSEINTEPKRIIRNEDNQVLRKENDIIKAIKNKLDYEDRNFSKQLDRFIRGTLPSSKLIDVCDTPNILKIVGSTAPKVILKQSDLKNAIGKKDSRNHSEIHNISTSVLRKIPKEIRNPIMVLQGRKNNTDSVVLITELQSEEKKNIILPISLNRNNGKINKLITIYDKNDIIQYLNIHKNEIIAINIKKADNLFSSKGLQLSELLSDTVIRNTANASFGDKGLQSPKSISDTIIYYDDSIAYSLKNVKYPEEKSSAPSCERIVIDTETTGLSPFGGDELLQVSIINTEGTVLYNEYVKPTAHEAWEAAMAVNNITPEMVAGAKTIEEQLSEISKITLNAKEIIGYNTYFDINFLSVAGVEFSDTVKVTDVKADFTERHGVWDKYKGDFKWIKLTECAEHYGYDWNSNEGQAHNSVSDCFATLHCYNEFRKEIEREREEQQARKAQRAEKYAMTLQNDKVRIYVDMDGTLARFHDEVKYLERMWEEGFFEQLKPFQEMVDGIKLLKQQNPNAEVFILSAAIEGEPPYCQRQKHEWLDRYLPEIDKEHRIFTKIGTPKADYIKGGVKMTDILIDDYNKGLEEWQRFGGTAVKCHNNINHKGLIGKLWDGKIIHNFEAPEKICKDIVQIANSLPGTSGQGEALKRTASPVRHKEQEQSHRKR